MNCKQLINMQQNEIYNSDEESVKALEEYFMKLKRTDLVYYLEDFAKHTDMPIKEFFNSNVQQTDINSRTILLEHYELAYENLISYNKLKKKPIHNEKLIEIKKHIKISFITNSIYWKNVFVVKSNIFINLSYIDNVKRKISTNNYTRITQIVLSNDKIYDKELLINLTNSLCYILLNSDLMMENWNKTFYARKYELIDMELIKFNQDYKIINIPDTFEFTLNKIVMCKNNNLTKLLCILFKSLNYLTNVNIAEFENSNNKYSFGVINSISSISLEPTFSPYWCTIVILFEYIDGFYYELNSFNIDDMNLNLEQSQMNYFNVSNPFVNQIENFTNEIYECEYL